ncbi:MAG: molybdopterin-dependent oxidoreductase [candidate division KSB1 bacterium]|nr:molybdopterin-dependent oxidoreductase [candidate division KSB1 bacterium]
MSFFNGPEGTSTRRTFLQLLMGMIGWLVFPMKSLARRIWPVRSVEKTPPPFDPLTWRLTVTGLVEHPASFSLDDLKKMPLTHQTSDLDCVERWSVRRLNWEGLKLKTLIDQVKPLPEAQFVTFHCSGEVYSESLSMEQAMDSSVLLAFKVDDKPLPPDHGAPLRLVVPSFWGYKSAKWIERIEFSKTQHIGYWERRGYDIIGKIPAKKQ